MLNDSNECWVSMCVRVPLCVFFCVCVERDNDTCASAWMWEREEWYFISSYIIHSRCISDIGAMRSCICRITISFHMHEYHIRAAPKIPDHTHCHTLHVVHSNPVWVLIVLHGVVYAIQEHIKFCNSKPARLFSSVLIINYEPSHHNN